MSYTFTRIYISCFVLLIAGCGQDEILQVGLHGTLTGYVGEYSTGGFLNSQNVEVTIEGTDPVMKLTTDSKGKFETTDIVTGTYNITYKKPGYGVYKLLGYSFVGGNGTTLVPSIALYKMPGIKITGAKYDIVSYPDISYVNFTILTDNTESETMYGSFRYYLSTDPDVSSTKYMESATIGSYYGNTEHHMQKSFDINRFPKGSTFYVVFYPCSEEYSYYIDIDTGKKIFCSIGESHSEVLTIQIPK